MWGPPQLVHRGGEEEQQPGVALKLPLPGQVGLGHRCMARVWLREQMGQMGPATGHLGATWPNPQQFLHCVHQQKNHLAPHLSPLTLCAGRSRRL